MPAVMVSTLRSSYTSISVARRSDQQAVLHTAHAEELVISRGGRRGQPTGREEVEEEEDDVKAEGIMDVMS